MRAACARVTRRPGFRAVFRNFFGKWLIARLLLVLFIDNHLGQAIFKVVFFLEKHVGAEVEKTTRF